MQPRILTIPDKKLVGNNKVMSLSNNHTAELWQSFMPRRREVVGRVNGEMISMQVYREPINFGDLSQEFEKWAVVEVCDFEQVPEGMSTYILNGGLYAVFDYKGLSTDSSIFIYIFGTWLPNSDYELDDRPHFEVLGDKYRNGDPDSEEEIWIPVKLKV